MTSDTTPEHLTVTSTDRGFQHLPDITGTHGGTVRVYESSTAAAPHIWLTAEDGGRVPLRVSLHLTAADAVKLSEQLAYLAAHHYQNEGIVGDD